MTKSEILHELPSLSKSDREEIMDCLWQIKESNEQPTEREKALLDEATEEYERNPNAGYSWKEVKAMLKKRKSR